MIAVGAQYYRPPTPPRSDWARDLAMMREHGFNTVKLWCCWSWMNPRPGNFDFDELDDLMELASRNGLRVVLNTILENAPYWLEGRCPYARYVDSEGKAVHLSAAMNTPGGGWPGLCFDNEEVSAAAHEFLSALVTRYSAHESLAVWDVWNEPHLEPASYYPERWYCYCSASLAKFRSWLTERCTDLGALNARWSRRFDDWQEVAPPRLFETVPDLMDWREFWFQNLRAWLFQRVDTVRRADPAHPVMTHVALSGFTGQMATHTLDEHLLGDVADIFGISSFPEWLMGSDPVEHLFNLEAARAGAGEHPYWQAELQGGRGRRYGERSTRHPPADDVALWMWDAVASGASGVMFWQWRPELLGPESPGYGLCTPDGGSSPRLEAASRAARDLLSGAFDGITMDPAEVAVVVSRRTALHTFATDRSMTLYTKAVIGAFRMLSDGDVHVTLLHEDAVGQATKLGWLKRLYWPMPLACSEAVASELARFVSEGGTLVAEASPGEYDETGRHRSRWPGGELAAVFGVNVVENDTTNSAAVRFQDFSLVGGWQVDRLELSGAQAIGYFADDQVASTTRSYGKGRAVLIGTYPSIRYEDNRDGATRDAVTKLLNARAPTGFARWRQPQPGLFTRSGSTRDGEAVLFFLNWTSAVQELDCLVPYAVLGERNVERSLVKDHGTVAIVPSHGAAQMVMVREMGNGHHA